MLLAAARGSPHPASLESAPCTDRRKTANYTSDAGQHTIAPAHSLPTCEQKCNGGRNGLWNATNESSALRCSCPWRENELNRYTSHRAYQAFKAYVTNCRRRDSQDVRGVVFDQYRCQD